MRITSTVATRGIFSSTCEMAASAIRYPNGYGEVDPIASNDTDEGRQRIGA
jgi:hypothetical protein